MALKIRETIQVLERPHIFITEDGSVHHVLALEAPKSDGEPYNPIVRVVTQHGLQGLKSEFGNKIIARQPATYILGIVNGNKVTERKVMETFWGGEKKPFYERRIRRAQRGVANILIRGYLQDTSWNAKDSIE